MNVKTNTELINSINSKATINLYNGDYCISNLVLADDENVYYENVFDGRELIIKDLNDLSFIGIEDNVNILVEPRYANVITFIGCNNIKISNIFLGHTLKDGYCTGGVLKFINCSNVTIEDCNIFGCGRIGIDALNCSNFNIKSSNIYECSEEILKVINSRKIVFDKCSFYNNGGYSFFTINNCKNMEFNGCNIYKNELIDYGWKSNLFDIIDTVVEFNETRIEDNIVNSITNKKNEKMFKSIELKNNICISKEIFSNQIKNKSEEIIEEELNNGYKLVYGEENEIKLIKEISIDRLASKPNVSPDKSRLIYISPYEWEVLGDLHLCNLDGENVKSEIILSAEKISEMVDPSKKVKVAKWKNNEQLYLIIGQGYGTVSEGGDLYIYDIIKNKLSKVYTCNYREEIVNFEVNEEKINLTIVKFTEELEVDKYISKAIKL